MKPAFRRRITIRNVATVSAGALVLSGCATLGGNVRGSFSCSAPDGICAPSATIDDRALAMVSAEAGSDLATHQVPAHLRSIVPARGGFAAPPRSPEKVLKIVFLPFVDERGRLHDTSFVHAVVENGDWMSAPSGFAATSIEHQPQARGSAEALADAVDRADPPGASHDPNVPDADAVAAARARRANPVGAIKTDVAVRPSPASDSDKVRKAAVELVLPSPTSAPPALGVPLRVPAAADPKQASTGDGGGEVVRKTGDRTAVDAVSEGARRATARGAEVPLGPAPAVRASNFPATIPEEK